MAEIYSVFKCVQFIIQFFDFYAILYAVGLRRLRPLIPFVPFIRLLYFTVFALLSFHTGENPRLCQGQKEHKAELTASTDPPSLCRWSSQAPCQTVPFSITSHRISLLVAPTTLDTRLMRRMWRLPQFLRRA